MSISKQEYERLLEIKDEIKNLMYEAKDIIRSSGQSRVIEASKAYWLGHIFTALDDDSDYLGGASYTMQNAIDEVFCDEDAEEEEDEAEVSENDF